jgi:hypothetical protein
MLFFRHQLLAPRRRQFVVARPPFAIGHAPLRLDPTLRFQTIERGIKRPLLDTQNVFRHLLNSIRDGQAVSWILLQRF